MARYSKPALVLAAFLALSGCRVEVYDGLSQRDANEMTALLLASGLDAERQVAKDGAFSVLVSEKDFAEAVRLISAAGLPRQQFATMVDVINDDRLIASPNEERARLAYALSQELSRTVSEIEGVITARVHLALRSDDPLARDRDASTASVAIQHDPDFNTSGLVPRIKLLVANAVSGLQYDNVSIALFPASGRAPRVASPVFTAENAPQAPVDASSEFASYMPALSPDRARGAQDGGYAAAASSSTGAQGASPRYAALAAILAGGLLILFFAARSLIAPPPRRAPLRARSRDRRGPKSARPDRRS